MLTKEEILAKNFNADNYGFDTLKEDLQIEFALNPSIDKLEKAMEEYAKQEAIAFKEWQDSNLEEKKWENYDGHDTWINPHTREVISTNQLYELYLLQSKQI